MALKWVKLFLRLALAASFLSAVADRFGFWPEAVSAWGNWNSFLEYTEIVNPWYPVAFIPTLAVVATVAELLLGLLLLIGLKTRLAANLSGILLLLFALSMTFSTGLKGALDYSVFTAAAAAFALGAIREKFLEVDSYF